MVVGPHVPGVYANLERVRLVSDLGVTVLVFAIGLEFNLRRLVRLARTAGLVALIQAAWIIWGYLVGRLMGWTPWESLVAGAIVSISGAVIVAKAFEEVRVDSRVRELVFGVVLCVLPSGKIPSQIRVHLCPASDSVIMSGLANSGRLRVA
jgi:CPA2 family monovalent cation:H+ antiporter-2